MSSTIPGLNSKCSRCFQALGLGALVCPQCHALVHAAELERISAGARALEEQGMLLQAREHWLKAVQLLPQESTQSAWVRDHLRTLEQAAITAPAPPEAKNKWIGKLGPLAPIALVLAKGKVLFLTIFKLKFLLSLVVFMGFYWREFGAKFGVGFGILILIHELGHYIDIKRRGLPADMPVFLPGLGAYVRWQALGVSAETCAAVSLAGPLAGWISAAACALLWWKTGSPLWAALARAGAWLNVLNLIPVWVLDGGQAVLVLNKVERLILLTVCLGLYFVFGESVFILVAAGACWRLFTKDFPSQPSRATTAYFVAVLTSLGFVMWLMPGQGFGNH